MSGTEPRSKESYTSYHVAELLRHISSGVLPRGRLSNGTTPRTILEQCSVAVKMLEAEALSNLPAKSSLPIKASIRASCDLLHGWWTHTLEARHAINLHRNRLLSHSAFSYEETT